jgi:hypothetical protein
MVSTGTPEAAGIVGDIDRALPHFREAIRLRELLGNTYGAAIIRGNVTITIAQYDRYLDDRESGLPHERRARG